MVHINLNCLIINVVCDYPVSFSVLSIGVQSAIAFTPCNCCTNGQTVTCSVQTVRRFVKLVQQTDHPTLLRTANQFETPPRDTSL